MKLRETKDSEKVSPAFSNDESKHQHIWGYVVLESREGNGTPLQYSCLENPMDGGAWWAAVHGVARSRT